jgi:hypothetical protein
VKEHEKGDRRFDNLRCSITPREGESWLFSCDKEGRLQTGIEQAKGTISVALHDLPAGCVRIYLVQRQFGWRVGDPIEPITLMNGEVGVRTLSHDGQPERVVELARSSDIPAGSYQFIARAFPPGWYEANEDRLLVDDIVSDRRFASLVVRLPFNKRFGYQNGVVITPEIAGRPLAHRPYFRFLNNFPKGTDVYAALDPDALPNGLVSQRAAIYVIEHKTAAQWSGSTSLVDVSGPGMTSAPKIVPIVPGCINWNSTLVCRTHKSLVDMTSRSISAIMQPIRKTSLAMPHSMCRLT